MHAILRAVRHEAVSLHRNQDGQAIFIGVFYFLLLAALVFMVINSGDKAASKTEMQNAADAAAYTGSSWYCRSMNTISMCNVTQTQLMSVIVLLDSLETTVPVATQIIDDLIQNLNSTPHGSNVPNDERLKDWLIVTDALKEQQVLQKLQRMIDRVPMDHYCAYDDGVLWQCCFVLNELATQMAEIAPEMAQREAIKVGKENAATVAFVLPFYPELPIVDIDNSGASFVNFKRPMRDARHPTRRDRRNRPIRLYGYQRIQHYISQRGNGGGLVGPFLYMREPFTDPVPMGLFELSRLSTLMRTVSDKKFEMLFGDPDPMVALYEGRMEDYDEVVNFVRGGGRVLRTHYSTMRFDSRYEYGSSEFLSNTGLRHSQYPRERQYTATGFRQPPSGYTRATEQEQGADARHDLWYRSTEQKTYHYPQLGIYAPHPPYDADGNSWSYDASDYQTYYRNDLWRFDGAEVALDTELHRRYLPPVGQPPRTAPIILAKEGCPSNETRTTDSGAITDESGQESTEEHIFDYFSFMGFAYRTGRSPFWPGIFRNPLTADGQMVCYGQTQAFNLTSWDLFAQNWRTHLVKMNHWNESLDMIEAGFPGEATLARDALDSEMLEPVRLMLEQYDADFVDLISH
ncbi:MAG: Tad domain-containing protein [Planctomycetes bacterium]|nr:Tad domain-containing protein [Planctomycetota bacterium]